MRTMPNRWNWQGVLVCCLGLSALVASASECPTASHKLHNEAATRYADHFVAGREEVISLPEFGAADIQAKIDTGAYTSSMGAEILEIVDDDGRQLVRFKLQFGDRNQIFESEIVKEKSVRSSNNEAEIRPVIETELVIGPRVEKILFNLTDRSNMRKPVLIGRTALEGVLIDPNRKNILSRP